MRKIIFTLILIGIVSMAAAFKWYQWQLNQPLNIQNDYVLEIKKGQTLNSIAKTLIKDGVLDDDLILKLYSKRQKNSHLLKAGKYRLNTGLNIPALMDELIKGKVSLEKITIPEGLSFKEMLALLYSNENILATQKGKSTEELMLALGLANLHPEGRFLPETYSFAAGTSDVTLLKQANAALDKALNAAWEERSAHSQLKSPYEALILASIIERETGVFEEQPTISGVFHSRLSRGMRLQTDPTVIYGMGDRYTGDIRRSDLSTDTPYNTYTRSGLPPTPIALPGVNAIRAAVNPEQHNKLYFVATGDNDGRHIFSATLEEHNRAVKQYLRKYRQQHR